MIENGLIKVDGKTVLKNMPVSPKNTIEIFTKNGEKYTPIKQNSKIWIFYKPKGLICTHDGKKYK